MIVFFNDFYDLRGFSALRRRPCLEIYRCGPRSSPTNRNGVRWQKTLRGQNAGGRLGWRATTDSLLVGSALSPSFFFKEPLFLGETKFQGSYSRCPCCINGSIESGDVDNYEVAYEVTSNMLKFSFTIHQTWKAKLRRLRWLWTIFQAVIKPF